MRGQRQVRKGKFHQFTTHTRRGVLVGDKQPTVLRWFEIAHSEATIHLKKFWFPVIGVSGYSSVQSGNRYTLIGSHLDRIQLVIFLQIMWILGIHYLLSHTRALIASSVTLTQILSLGYTSHVYDGFIDICIKMHMCVGVPLVATPIMASLQLMTIHSGSRA